MGTYGYAAPEYMATGTLVKWKLYVKKMMICWWEKTCIWKIAGHLYVKSDVYGFGVVLLELLTGRAALDTTLPTDMQNLVQCSMSSLNDKKRLQKIMDPKLDYQYSPRAAFHIAQVIIKCLESDHRKRPSMVDVLATLEKAQSMKYRPKGNKASAIRQTSDVHHPNYPRSSPSPLHYKNND